MTNDPLLLTYTPSQSAYFNDMGDEFVLLQIERGIYFGIDGVGSYVWRGIVEGIGLDSICDGIAREFGVPLNVVRSDVLAFIDELVSSGLVVAR